MERRLLENRCRPADHLLAVADEPYPALLESTLPGKQQGRYSILCWSPFKKLTVTRGGILVEYFRDGGERRRSRRPFRVMSQEFSSHRLRKSAAPDLPFCGGVVGYFSYDLRHWIERLPRRCKYDINAPHAVLCFYDHAVVFDHEEECTHWVALSGCTEEPPDSVPETPEEVDVPGCRMESNFTRQEYMHAVRRAREYIAAGDIFQVNLSQRFSGQTSADGLDLYRRLRSHNPGAFAGYLKYPGLEIMSSSPERFLLLDGDRVTTRPIKGTRPRRPGDEEFNRRMVEELTGSEKDLAELAMIVDLERNDLGRACSYGSVTVDRHAEVERYSTVFHLVSTVSGRLHRPAHDEFSLLKGAFPGGSITGAPKIRAMEIIEELEPHARGPYTGSMGYISFHGRMDLNIMIRTAVKVGDRLHMQFGGGIVADSDPREEYMETLDKGRAMLRAAGASNYDTLFAEQK
ncbi:MAG: aminodeoxychorismate synthase component I, partial [Planctomycetota bacterium]